MIKLILLFLLCTQFSIAQELALVLDKNKYGYFSKNGEFAIQPKFKNAKSFSEDLASAREKSKWGYINRKGEWVIQPQFEKAEDFRSGIALVRKDKDWFYINKKGEKLFSNDSDEQYSFQKIGLAYIRKGNKVGMINTTGEVILPPLYDIIREFRGDFARVRNDGKWGIIDKAGKEVIPVEYDEIGNMFKNVTYAKKGETYGLIINTTFKPVEGATKIWDFHVQDLTLAQKDNKIGYINLQGNWAIAPQFERGRVFVKNLAPVFYNDNWGYIDTSGKFVIEPKYKDAEIFSEDGLAPVRIKYWGFIDETGKLVIPDDYGITMNFVGGEDKGFINGIARVRQMNKVGYLKTDGTLLGDKWFKDKNKTMKGKLVSIFLFQ